jgi:predicted ATPase
MQQGLAALRAAGAGIGVPYYLCLLAEAYAEIGNFDEGLGALSEALTIVRDSAEQWWVSETYRLRGELLLQQNDCDAAEAHSCFEQSIELARAQSAKSHELRATMSLARLLRDTGRRDEAHAMLAEIYGWFTEGFDTADLKDAKALLDDVRS